MNKILSIYPDDYTTKFLNRVQTFLKAEFGNEFHCFKIKANRASHNECIRRLSENVDEEVVLFFGHGGPDYLFGATNESIALSETPRIYDDSPLFDEERFLDRSNIQVLSGKRVFCFSCASAPTLARLAVLKGAKVFLGFGAIPTEAEEFKIKMHRFPMGLVRAAFKAEIVWIIKHSLAISIRRNFTFEQLASTIRLLTHVRINRLITVEKNRRHRRLIADYLFNFIGGMIIVGDRHARLG